MQNEHGMFALHSGNWAGPNSQLRMSVIRYAVGRLTESDCHLGNQGPFYYYGLTSNPAWIRNHMLRKVLDALTYPFPNLNGCTIEVYE